MYTHIHIHIYIYIYVREIQRLISAAERLRLPVDEGRRPGLRSADASGKKKVCKC